MKLKIAVLPGDGIGKEITDQGVKVLQAIAKKFNHQFTFTTGDIGAVAIEKTGDPLPDATLEVCRKAEAVLFGAIGDPKYDLDPEAKVRPEQGYLKLRKSLDLFVNIRPIRVFEGLAHKSPLKATVIKNTDFVILSQPSGGIYFGEKKRTDNGKTASDNSVYRAEEIDKIAHWAFKFARTRSKKLTLIDKANMLETSRLWRKRLQELSKEYPDVYLSFMFIENASMQLILNPRQFDVILTEAIFGDMLSASASAISGSVGLSASASIGEKTSLFEPIHGAYVLAKGKNIANPIATILSAAMLLEHFELFEEADSIRNAIDKSIELEITTADINSSQKFTTTDVGNFIHDFIIDKKSVLTHIENISLGQSTII
jgi:3-isopropylmalate dehydrogenase